MVSRKRSMGNREGPCLIWFVAPHPPLACFGPDERPLRAQTLPPAARHDLPFFTTARPLIDRGECAVSEHTSVCATDSSIFCAVNSLRKPSGLFGDPVYVNV